MDEYEVKDSKGNVHTVKVPKGSPPPSQAEIEALMGGGGTEKPVAPMLRRPDLAGGHGESISGRVPSETEIEGYRRAGRDSVDEAMKQAGRLRAVNPPPGPRRPGTNRSIKKPVTASDVFAGLWPAVKDLGGGLAGMADAGVGLVSDSVQSIFDPSARRRDRIRQEIDVLANGLTNVIPFQDVVAAGFQPDTSPSQVLARKWQENPGGVALDAALTMVPLAKGRMGKGVAAADAAATQKGMGAGARFASMLQRKPGLVGGPSEAVMVDGRTLVITPDGQDYAPLDSKPDLPAIEPVKASPFFTANKRIGRRSSVDLAKLEPVTDDPLANALSSRIADETIGAPGPNIGSGLPRPTEFGKRAGGRISDQFANTPGGAVADWLETRLENIDPNLPNALTPEETVLAVREVGAFASGRIPRITKSTAMLLDRSVGSGWRETLADATKKVPKLRSNSVYSESLPYPPGIQPHIGEGAPVPTVGLDSGHVSAMSSLLDESAPRRAMDSRSATPNELLAAIDGMEGISDVTRTKLRRQLLKGQLTTEFYDTVDSHFGVGPNVVRMPAPEGSAGLASLIPDEVKAWGDLPDEVKWSMEETPRAGVRPGSRGMVPDDLIRMIDASAIESRFKPRLNKLIREGRATDEIYDVLDAHLGFDPRYANVSGRGGAPLMGENSRAARGGRGRPRQTSLEPKKGVDPKSARGRFEAIAKIANAPRDLMYGFELSAMGRQAAKLGASNPKAYVQAVKSGFRALKSDELAAAERAAMGRSPYADLHKKFGLATSDAMAEEFRPSLIDEVKGLGPASKRFKEHFEVTIEKMRQETFDRQVDAWKKSGFKPQDRHFNELADYVNTMTGRGDLGILDPKKSKVKAIQNLSRVLDETMASPRLQASYLNAPRMLLDPRISKPMRVKAAREMGIQIGTTAGLVALAKQAGFKVEEDPTATNWGKIEIPGRDGAKTYVDLWGGYQPWARLVAQEAKGMKNGKKLGTAGRFGLLLKRGESTLAPTPGLAIDLVRGKDFTGQDVTPGEALATRAWPIAYQDVVAAIKAHGGAKGSALGGLALLGVNVSTYEKRKKAGGD